MDWRIICIFLVGFSIVAHGQEKIEREYRVKEREAPGEAREWLNDAFEGRKKVKWFREETSGKSSYEAKFNWEEADYSVEFDLSGTVEDIEIIKNWENLSSNLRQNLEAYFDKHYRKWRLEKIQLQYSGSPDDLEDLIDEDEMEGILTRYEIEYYGDGEEGKNLWEGTFDKDGHVIDKRVIIIPPADNLFF
ncbi:hypothetical protein [Cyclobacterium salsum]|uniref:hypothetical protein n=1 Tax=Cyclobacterium salsum TaxID=2666329 RepID=UPI001390D654|nr:hypothetical protein [Cyclobacterium salsum]